MDVVESSHLWVWLLVAREDEFQPLQPTLRASQVAWWQKNLPANREDTGDVGLITGSGRSASKGKGNPLQYSCWEIPCTEEPDYSLHDRKEWDKTGP